MSDLVARTRRLSRTQGLGFTYAPGYNAGPPDPGARVRVLVACDNDPDDPRAYSGTLRSVLDAVAGMAGVEVVGTVDCSRAIAASLDKDEDATLFERYGETTLVAAAAAVDEALRRHPEAEVLFVADGNCCVPRLESKIPVVWWNDCSWACWLHESSGWRHVGGAAGAAAVPLQAQRFLAAWDAAALNRASAAFLASDWAVEVTRRAYGADVARTTARLPYGAAHAAHLPGRAAVDDAVVRRNFSPRSCVVCFVASEAGFDHKGGRVAMAAVEHLRESARAALRDGNGSDRLHALARASLVCVGAGPPPGVEVPDWVDVAGWCDRSSPAGRAKFADALMGAHFVCIPSRADFYGVTLVEALAHGVPVVAARVGGAATIVRAGRGGALVDADAPPSAYADAVAELFLDGGNYGALAAACRGDYDARLDWAVSRRALAAAFLDAKAGKRTCADAKE